MLVRRRRAAGGPLGRTCRSAHPPSAVLFAPLESGQTKVTDFGIAKAVSGTKLSSSGILIGTFAYIDPERRILT
jgi:serine/threonine protein kinase